MHKTYRAIVIGCGRVGATFEMDSGLVKPASHAAALIKNPRTELVALVDPDPAALKRASDYYQVPAYADARACIEELHPDIVVIATPPETHEPMLTLALELNIPAVICEKPVSDALSSAQRMIAQVRESKTVVILNHQRRFLPLFKEWRERIAAGELGDIQQVSAYYSNGLLNNGTHTIDTLNFLLGDTAAWAIGVENKKNITAPFGANIDGMLSFKKGAVAMIQSFDNNFYSPHEYQIFGTKGALLIRHHGFRFEHVLVTEGVTFEGMRELDWVHAEAAIDRRSMLEGTVAHVVDCLEGVSAPQSTLEDGYDTMQTLDALVRSAAEGGKRIII